MSIDASLERAQERLRMAVRAGAVGVWDWDLQTDVVYFSPEWKRQIGYEDHEIGSVVGEWESRLHPDDVAHAKDSLRSFVDGPQRDVFQTEFRLRHRDGTYRWILSLASLTRDDAGRPARLLGCHVDITAQKTAQQALRDSEARLRDTLEALMEGCLVVDREWRYVFLNEAAILQARRPRASFLGRTMMECYPGIESTPVFAAMRYSMEKRVRQRLRSEFNYPDGSSATFDLRLEPQPTGLAILSIDVTEALRAESFMGGQKRVLEQMASGRPLAETLTALVGVVEEQAPEIMGSVLLLDADGTTLRHASAPRLDARYTSAIDGAQIGPQVGSCGTAAFRRAPVYVRDVATDPLWADYRGLAAEHGLKACWSTPILDVEGRVLGTFAFYLREAALPEPRHLALFDVAVRLAAIAIARTREEEQLRESEGRFRQLADSIQEVFWMLDVERRQIIYISPAYESIWGRSCEGLLQNPKDWAEAIAPEDRARVLEAAEHEAEGTYDVEYRIVRPDGSRRWVRARAFPVRDAAGRVFRVAGVAQDVTERKRGEEALRHSEEKFATAFRSSPDGLALARLPDGTLLDVNDAFLAISGYAREEVLGRTTTELRLWAEPKDREEYLRRLQTEGHVRDLAGPFRNKAGELRDCLISGELVRLGQDVMSLTTLRDVTDRKRAEEERHGLESQLRQAQKLEAIGRLAGGVAHDFNNMLGVILGYTDRELALRRSSDPVYASLISIRDAAERSAELTRQLLAFSRQQKVEPRVIDLNAQVAGMEKLLRHTIGEDIALTLALEPALWPVSMDPSQVDQALVNLAINARDSMPGGGRLAVETRNVLVDAAQCRRLPEARPGPHVMLAVTDNGSGMDDETRERAFEPFFTTKPESKGTGLGLATVYGIVKQNDGFIELESAPGTGTAVRLYLPRTESDQAVRPAAAADGTPPARGRETILLVEDEPNLRELTARLLTDLGYRVLSAPGPLEALALCEDPSGPIHLLLTDVVMPEMNGRQLADRVRAQRAETRVLFMSGYTQDAVAERGVSTAGMPFLAKPFSLAALSARVREVLGG
jgi:two-component system, cell cycle sensor histidine kinase and response regulator CckA